MINIYIIQKTPQYLGTREVNQRKERVTREFGRY
jgi:hypothetical protein